MLRMGVAGRVLKEARLAVDAEALEKRYDPAEKAHCEPDIEITDIRRHGMFLYGLSPGLGRSHDRIMAISRRIYKSSQSIRKVNGSGLVLLLVRRFVLKSRHHARRPAADLDPV